MRILTGSLFLLLLIYSSLTVSCASGSDKSNLDNQKPKNIIFLIGDGMGLTQVTAAHYAKQDKLALSNFPFIGLITTHAIDKLITDSAAGATAFSTGQKTYNGAIAVDTSKKAMRTIMEDAVAAGLSTGLVVTSTITHATPGSYYAHQPSRKMEEEIAQDLLNSGVDIAIGGGRVFFNARKDGKNLLEAARQKGYQVIDSLTGSEDIKKKCLGFVSSGSPKKASEGRSTYLNDASIKVMKRLSENKKGFFMVIEGSQIDWGGHANDSEYIIQESLEFDKVIKSALDFAKADGNTLVVVTADHETGGYAINEGNLKGEIKGAFTTGYHTATMVPVFAYGPGSINFSGMYDNTDIYYKMKKLLGL